VPGVHVVNVSHKQGRSAPLVDAAQLDGSILCQQQSLIVQRSAAPRVPPYAPAASHDKPSLCSAALHPARPLLRLQQAMISPHCAAQHCAPPITSC